MADEVTFGGGGGLVFGASSCSNQLLQIYQPTLQISQSRLQLTLRTLRHLPIPNTTLPIQFHFIICFYAYFLHSPYLFFLLVTVFVAAALGVTGVCRFIAAAGVQELVHLFRIKWRPLFQHSILDGKLNHRSFGGRLVASVCRVDV